MTQHVCAPVYFRLGVEKIELFYIPQSYAHIVRRSLSLSTERLHWCCSDFGSPCMKSILQALPNGADEIKKYGCGTFPRDKTPASE